MAKNKTRPDLYALLIGIDEYREDIWVAGASFPKLSGCVNDTDNIHYQLKKEKNYKLKPLVLHNEEATKPAICEAFTGHLSAAGKDDVVFVYYSGHGTCEHADTEVWKDQGSGRLEALACYYDHNHHPSFLLTDKELRYLIAGLYKKTKAHIVTIFDCCHSGDNTRSIKKMEVQEKRVDFIFPQREWKDFIFSDKFTRKKLKENSVSKLLPQGRHIQMSASESDEPAIEVGGKGVFTTHLLRTWRMSGGHLSYRDLHSRVRNRMRGIYEQKPKLYAPKKYEEILQNGFINKTAGESKAGNIIFNEGKNAWVLNKGSLNGVVAGVTEATVTVGGKIITGQVNVSGLDDAYVDFGKNNDLLESELDYDVSLTGLQKGTINIRVVNNGLDFEQSEKLFDSVFSEKSPTAYTLEDDEKKAEYELVCHPDYVYWKKSGRHEKPLTAPVFTSAKDFYKTVAQQLGHIGTWQFLNKFKNNGASALPQDLLEVEFFRVSQGAEGKINVDSNQEFQILLDKIGDGGANWGGTIKIKVTNHHLNNLYVAGIYQSEEFSSLPILFEPVVKMIEPGKSEWVFENNGDKVPLQLDPKWYFYNWEKAIDTIKFIYSTVDFRSDEFVLEAVASPPYPNMESVHRGALRVKKKPVLIGWNSLTYNLVFPNPTFNKNNSGKCKTMRSYISNSSFSDLVKNGLLEILAEIYE